MKEKVEIIKQVLCEWAEYLNDGDRIEVYENEIRLYNRQGCMIASRRLP